ncbi:hypothetical protein FRB95_002686 [Tulasnella sp. JGI-2019a]|nr:hypothetical protein FRB95_002686 [Tulasnella sp. JGI-2019a]
MESIFLASKDVPLSIYVQEDTDLDQVTHLKTLVKMHGGAAIDSSEAANIIVIVDRNNPEGIELSRNHAVRPGERMKSAVVDQSWIKASIDAGEILVDNEWGGHLIRATPKRMIDDVLRGRPSLTRSTSSHQAPPPQAGPSKAIAGSSMTHQGQDDSLHLLQEPPIPVRGLSLQQNAGIGIVPPPIERRNRSIHNRLSSPSSSNSFVNKSKPDKGKGRAVDPPGSPAEDNSRHALISSLKAKGQGRGKFHAATSSHANAVTQIESGDGAHINQGWDRASPSTRNPEQSGRRQNKQGATSRASMERDPSPSPPQGMELRNVRGTPQYKYTSAEKRWTIDYTNWLLKGEPKITLMGLCSQLHNKVPHHSLLSWHSHLRLNARFYTQGSPLVKALLGARASGHQSVGGENDSNYEFTGMLTAPTARSLRARGRLVMTTESLANKKPKYTTFTEADREAVILFLVNNPQAYYPRTSQPREHLDTIWERFCNEDASRSSRCPKYWCTYHRDHAQEFQAEADRIRLERDQRTEPPRGTAGTFEDPMVFSSDEEDAKEVFKVVTTHKVKMEVDWAANPGEHAIGVAGPSKKREASKMNDDEVSSFSVDTTRDGLHAKIAKPSWSSSESSSMS